ncbi:helix-turn-helix domain-containing protein [Pandoraea cepalis]|uniref:Helix-hairpin-helix DNA-binding motif-containing protein n=1 Tax=Pandoraea cepalis TaxID=2508294 RepID=A0A5E4S154_9BURK|nr:helix-turn-helix transcriptional regulator [Pandoraea cepalis]VVD68452.1 helix-hairpin-helix DNA-binding motif-containing protein [Pandoraea cepalis]
MQTNPLALFGDHLACLRKARGWSQEKLALESGLARSYVSGIERGRRNVALVNICVLADTLGVPTSEMLRFAQAAGAADTAALPDRTPLPQISRSLCRLENRDQVWLAEIIRSLSSRLSQAAPPLATDAYADRCGPLSVAHGSACCDARDTRNRHEARDDIDDAEDLDDFDDLDDAAPPPAALPNAARQTPIAPAFSAGFPAHLQLAAPREADYRVADDTGTDAAHPVARICDPGRTPSERHDASVTSSNTARSDAIAREDSRHFPTGDDE